MEERRKVHSSIGYLYRSIFRRLSLVFSLGQKQKSKSCTDRSLFYASRCSEPGSDCARSPEEHFPVRLRPIRSCVTCLDCSAGLRSHTNRYCWWRPNTKLDVKTEKRKPSKLQRGCSGFFIRCDSDPGTFTPKTNESVRLIFTYWYTKKSENVSFKRQSGDWY